MKTETSQRCMVRILGCEREIFGYHAESAVKIDIWVADGGGCAIETAAIYCYQLQSFSQLRLSIIIGKQLRSLGFQITCTVIVYIGRDRSQNPIVEPDLSALGDRLHSREYVKCVLRPS